MIRLNNGSIVIGFDDGYQLSKTAKHSFDNGVHLLGGIEPTLIENSLFYAGNYYKVGEGRATITENKTASENARLLTMVAIAKELATEGLTKANVILAVGLPFSEYGRQKKALIQYYLRKPELEFEYEGVHYEVVIEQVKCFPQCYSAVASRIGNMADEWIIIDIGSKTTDIVTVMSGIPIESKSITIERAMIKWIKEIQGDLQVQFGKAVGEDEILKVALQKTCYLPTEWIQFIRTKLCEAVDNLELELAERGYDLKYKKVIYVGGGAIVVRNFSGRYKPNIAYDIDLNANAKGYEFLANTMLSR